MEMDARRSWWVRELLAADCTTNVAQPRMGRYDAAVVLLTSGQDEKRMRGREWKKRSPDGGADFLHRITKPAAGRGGLLVF